MQLPSQTQYLIDEYLEMVRCDPQHKITPVQRIPIYESFASGENSYANTAFLRLQIITARHVLPIWKESQPGNQLAEDLLQMAAQVLQEYVDREVFNDKLQEIWVDLDSAYANAIYPSSVFAAVAAAFEALRIMLQGFDKWVRWELTDENDDDLALWGNDSAMWASLAFAGYIMDTNSSFDQKRLEFWEWWLTEAIASAWDSTLLPLK